MFRPFLQKIRKGFHVSLSRGQAVINDVEVDEEINVATPMSDDVGAGYFTVFAVQGKETQRFVIELDNLTNPAFLSLLEQAGEEYGFHQKGVLSLPCRPQELQKILQDWEAEHADTEAGAGCFMCEVLKCFLILMDSVCFVNLVLCSELSGAAPVSSRGSVEARS
ncbi:SAUR-like auxin-responsive protein family, putative [Theobroma cacao]|uniref:SAUR-like auxin-responsive protein family, putative n=1 Tax=Theobroma cacao TaxID=3641 RepID=A0A061ETB8_THECC|nr:SAUR-like auxin-responsive protein family, putative [Theobroma cacao]